MVGGGNTYLGLEALRRSQKCGKRVVLQLAGGHIGRGPCNCAASYGRARRLKA
jgi:hypothetical protein